MKKVTDKKLEKYLKHGACCPACGSLDINGDSVEIRRNTGWQTCSCVSCGLEWTDNYTLTSIGNITYASDQR